MSTQTQSNKSETAAAPTTEVTRNTRVYRPNVDIFENAEALTLRIDVPGAEADAIDIRFEDGQLTIEARVEDRWADRGALLVGEYGVGDYRRSFRVSEEIDASRISADYKNGVLTLTLPKVEAAKPRKIAIQAG